jgi:glycosyltransferase involved in cell wall biosynthesis
MIKQQGNMPMHGGELKVLAPQNAEQYLTQTTGVASNYVDATQAHLPELYMHREHSNTISIVIPTKNEAQNIAWVLERIPAWIDEIVLVDGQSTDGTIDAARRVRPDIVVVEQKSRGKGLALQAGFAAATGDFIVMLDADGSMHPAEIDRYVALLSSGFDFVKGSRFMAGASSTDITWLRRFGNNCLLYLTNIIYGTRFTDLCYGYCAFRREFLSRLALTAPGFEIESQLIARACMTELRITEVPSLESPRRHGQSNLRTFRDGRRVLWTLLKEAYRPRDLSAPQDALVDITNNQAFDASTP